MIGKIYNSKNYGSFKIVSADSRYNYYTVKFQNTGNIDKFRKDAIKKGEVRDRYAPSLCGVGIIGNIKTRGKYKSYYTLWRNMITRCYDGNNKAYFNKVYVCEEWKIFESFYKDVQEIDGWSEREFLNGSIELDKDLKQMYSNMKIYSLPTCKWVDKHINCKIQNGQQKLFIGISPEGKEFTSDNITQFGREHGLERRQISSVLHGRYKTTLDWKFKFI